MEDGGRLLGGRGGAEEERGFEATEGLGRVSNDCSHVHDLHVKPHIAVAVEACRYNCSMQERRRGKQARGVDKMRYFLHVAVVLYSFYQFCK